MKMMRKDFLKKKVITIALFIFIMLSSLFAASGLNMITELTNSLGALFTKSDAPHLVQMHVGEINKEDINNFTLNNKFVEDSQMAEMIHIDESHVDLGENSKIENSIMDHYFVKQNESFDLLLNLESEVIQVSQGEIAVPIYYMQQNDITIGDKINISNQPFEMELKVVDFVRDVQMNPSIIHSKRFVINEADFNLLKRNYNEIEYLIEFQLTDLSKINDVKNAYQSANLPQKGPIIDYHLFKLLHAITDGVVVAAIIFVSILLILMAILCIRFIILATIEEDYREIGVMKAIGIQLQDIKRIYMIKYVVLSAFASLSGYVFSLFINHLFTANIMLYIGSAPKSLLLKFIPFFAVIIVFLFVIFSCQLTFRNLNKISAVEALRSRNIGGIQKSNKTLSLGKNHFFNVSFFLGLNDVSSRLKMYSFLFFVFIVCSFIMIVPVNFLNTVQSSAFIKYMGIEKSDLRIDLQQSDRIEDEFNTIISYIKNDKDIRQFSSLVTSQFKVVNSDGVEENIIVETGDFSIFPLDYLKGNAPTHDNEIALSYLNSKEMEKNIGDQLTLIINGQKKEMVVSGVYQDVTNGGRTAKALLPNYHDKALGYEVIMDVKPPIRIEEKRNEYAKSFQSAKVTDLNGYLSETFGNTVKQLRLFTILAIGIAIIISILITSLFLKLMVVKDSAETTIMKSIGFSLHDLRRQYVIRSLVVLVAGIIIGTILANIVGQRLVSALLSFVGAAKIEFIINPFHAYVLCPLLLIAVVTVTTLLSILSIKNLSIVELGAEG